MSERAPHDERSPQAQRRAVPGTETTGRRLIVFLLAVVTVVGYWHSFDWSLR